MPGHNHQKPSDPRQVERTAKVACLCRWEGTGSRSSETFSGWWRTIIMTTLPWCFISPKHSARDINRSVFKGSLQQKTEIMKGIKTLKEQPLVAALKHLQQTASSTCACTNTHIHTHTLWFRGATVGATRWLWGTTFDFCFLNTLILTWEENIVAGMKLPARSQLFLYRWIRF